MKRASIGLGLFMIFFLLAMFLMADAEVAPVEDPTLVTTSAATR